jgi:hypothetical protein
MATNNYQASFNSGELSRKMDGRSDLDVYRNGCRLLQNFYVMPQGGVERRTGTEFVDETAGGNLVNGLLSEEFSNNYINVNELIDANLDITIIFHINDNPSGNSGVLIGGADGLEQFTLQIGDTGPGVGELTATIGAGGDTYVIPYTFGDVVKIRMVANGDVYLDDVLQGNTGAVITISAGGIFAYGRNGFGTLDTASTPTIYEIKTQNKTLSTLPAGYFTDGVNDYFGEEEATNINPFTLDGFVNTVDEGDTAARLIPFVFSSDDAYAMEFGDGYVTAWYTDDNGDDQSVSVTGVVPYTEADVRAIQYVQRFDTLILTHPSYATQSLTRDTLTPTFSIVETAFDFPTLLDENETDITMEASVVGTPGGTITGTLTASAAFFDTGHVGSKFLIRHERTNAQMSVTKSNGTVGIEEYSPWLNVSYSNWRLTTGGTWTGALVVERRFNGDDLTKERHVLIGDTTNAEAKNFAFYSPIKEGANVEVRAAYTEGPSGGTIGLTISVENLNWDGLVEVTGHTSDTEVDITVISELASTDETLEWFEGAFSTFRGFPTAVSWHQDRLWFAGTDFEPATLYGSVSGDYYNFITGSEDYLSIKRIIDSPEESKWLLSKRFLFLGTAGSSIAAKSSDKNALITAKNIDTNSQSVYGSAPIQALMANDVVLYVQKNGLKVREMIYNWEEENYKSNDITILSENISDSGIVETFLQKQPDQNLWAIKANGDIGLLTYERGQEVVGWSRIETEGEVISGCALPNENGEDEVWICVKRLGKYLIERFHPRVDLDWYVDSGVEFDGATKSIESYSISSTNVITITNSAHGFSNGNLIRFKNIEGFDALNGKVLLVADATANTFTLKIPDDSGYYDIILDGYYPTEIAVSSAGSPFIEGPYIVDGFDDLWPKYRNTLATDKIVHFWFGNSWVFEDEDAPFSTNFYKATGNGVINKTGWTKTDVGQDPPPTISYDLEDITGDFCLVQNTLSGLDHLEGETVQVVVDGNYDSDQLVDSGTITLGDYGNTIVAGLQYVSKLQPMPIEPVTGEVRSQSRKKAVTKVSLLFYKTLGAKVGEPGLLETNFAALKTSDLADEPLSTFSGEVRVFMANNWERQKVIQIKQDLPYPMTVLSMSVWTKVTGA